MYRQRSVSCRALRQPVEIMIVLTGPVGGEGSQLLFRNGADRGLKPLPQGDSRAFLTRGGWGNLVLLRRIQGIQRLADNVSRRAVARLGGFLLDACIQVGRKRDQHKKSIP